MRRNSIILLLVLGTNSGLLFGQTKKRFTVDKSAAFEKLAFNLYSPSGTCQIRPTHHPTLVTIYCKSENDDYNPAFMTRLDGNTKFVSLDMDDGKSDGISRTLSGKVFKSSYMELENKCNVYLSHQKPVILDLKYGVGEAFADLSGLAIEKLKISTGSADVTVGYQEGKANLIAMDTFSIKVDLGSVTVKRVNLSRASNIIANVGFGDLKLELSDTLMLNTHVKASVGAGTLEISTDNHDIPTIIHVNNTILCQVELNKNFREIRDNVFVNSSYQKNAPKLITFNLDVAMGNIIFR